MSATLDRLDHDILACEAFDWDGNPRHCRGCNAELSGRQRRWCGREACDGLYGKQHWWSWARAEALKCDQHRCVRCGAESGPGVHLEVHHKTPILGRHSISGCHHHVAGLETLCSVCHLAEHHGAKPPMLFDPADVARVAREDRAATVSVYGEERVAELEKEANR